MEDFRRKVNRFISELGDRLGRLRHRDRHGEGEEPVLRLEKLAVAAGGRPLFAGLDLVVPPGRLLAVTGRRGAGKSALLQVMAGVRPARAGTVEIGRRRVGSAGLAARRVAAYVPSTFPRRPGLSLRRHFRRQAALCGLGGAEAQRRIEVMAERFGLAPRLGVEIGRLRPIEIAMAGLLAGLLRAPRLLCIDEPRPGLERSDRRLFWDELGRIRDEGLSLAAASRNMGDPWRTADEVLLLHDGKVSFPAADDLAGLERLSGVLEIRLESPPTIMPPELAAFRPRVEGRTLVINSPDPMGHLVDVVEAVLGAGLKIADFGIRDMEVMEDLFRARLGEKESEA